MDSEAAGRGLDLVISPHFLPFPVQVMVGILPTGLRCNVRTVRCELRCRAQLEELRKPTQFV